MEACPLCSSQKTSLYHRDKLRSYLRCLNCELIFVPKRYHLDQKTEKSRYDFHENNPSDPKYREFLSQVIEPLLPFLSLSQIGLDFGCGPGPTISEMLAEKNISCKNYDPYYFNNTRLLEKQYDFIVSTEVVEHFNTPYRSFQQLDKLLKEKAILAIMTGIFSKEIEFEKWHYIKDDTHIAFYSEHSFRWLATTFQYDILHQSKNVIIFQKAAYLGDTKSRLSSL